MESVPLHTKIASDRLLSQRNARGTVYKQAMS